MFRKVLAVVLVLISILVHTTLSARILYRNELVVGSNLLGDNVPAEKSVLNFPTGFAMWDSGKNRKPFFMAIADSSNTKIRIIDNDGIITSLYNPSIVNPTRILLDKNMDIYFTELGTHMIKKYLFETKQVINIAGNGQVGGYGNGQIATNSTLSAPLDIIMNKRGDIFFTDFDRHVIRVINSSTGIIDNYAGVDGVSGFDNNQTRLSALFNRPSGLSFSLDESELYVADSGNNCIRKIFQNGSVVTMAGNGTSGFIGDGGLAINALLTAPMCVFMNYKNELVICDAGNNKIRLISNTSIITTIAGNENSSLSLKNPYYATINQNDELYIADSSNNAIVKVSLSKGNYSKVVGAPDGSTSYYGDGVKPGQANLDSPLDVVYNPKTRELFFSDSKSIRKIATNGNVYLLSSPYSSKIVSEGSKLSDCKFGTYYFDSPKRIAAYGDLLYFHYSRYIYKVHKNGTLEIVAGDAFYSTPSFALYPNGDFLVSDTMNQVIRKFVWSEQRYYTIAGSYVSGNNGDGILATEASIYAKGIALSSNNEIYIADFLNSRIRKILTNGTIITIAGNGQNEYSGEFVPALSSINEPSAIGVLSNGSVVFIEGGRLRHLVSNTLVTVLSGISSKAGLYVHTNDTIYVANCQANSIQQTVIGGATITLPISGLNCPNKAIVINDAIYITENNYNGFVKKFENNQITIVAGNSDLYGKKPIPGVLSTEAKMIYPMDLALLPDGNLLVMENEGISFHNLTDGRRRTLIGYGEDVPSRHTHIEYTLEYLKVSSDDRLIHSFWAYSTVDTIYKGRASSLIGTQYTVKGPDLPIVQPLNETYMFYCVGAAFANGTDQIYYIDNANNLIRTLRSDNYVETVYKTESSTKDLAIMPNGDTIVYISSTENNIWRYPKNGERYSIASTSSVKLTADFETNKIYYIVDNSIRSLTPYCEDGYDFNQERTECIPICFGVKANSTGVCSGKGYCDIPNSCVCTANSWTGSNCNITYCYGIMSNNRSVCSGNGVCGIPNNCTCIEGYYGNQCELFDCYGKKACSNNGTCNGPGNCICTDGYGGLRCDYPYCYGITSDKTAVCNGKGTCVGINDCRCQSGWFGNNCNLTSCFGIDSNNASVCSNLKGQCVDKDVCQCSNGYAGSKCEYFKCYQKVEIDPGVCSGNGNCSGPHTCTCKNGYIGKECENYVFSMNYQSITLAPLVQTIIARDESFEKFNGKCESLFDSTSLLKLGEQPICVWNTNLTIYLGYNFVLETGDILTLKNSNISVYVSMEEAKSYSKTYASTSSKVTKLYSTIPSSSDLIVRPSIDSNYKFAKSIDYKWTCPTCGSTGEFIGLNRDILIIPKTYLSSTSSISLVLNTNNWMNNSKSSSKLDLKITSTGPNIEFFNDILDTRIISCSGFECILEIETFAPSQSISLYGNIFTNVLKNKHMIRVFSDANLEESEASLLCSAKDSTTSRDITVTLQYKPFTSVDLKLSFVGVDTKNSQNDSFTIEVVAENESSFRLSKLSFDWSLFRVENDTKLTTIPQSVFSVNSNIAKFSAGSLTPGVYQIQASTSDDNLGSGSVVGHFEITKSKPITVKIAKAWNSLSYSGCYIEAEITGNFSNYNWKVSQGRLQSSDSLKSNILAQSDNYLRTSIWMSGDLFYQEENYIFEIQALNGVDVVASNSYSFTSERLPRVSCDINLLSNSYLTISCDHMIENPLMILMEFNMDLKRKFIISNTLKKKVAIKFSTILPNSSIKVKVLSIDGNVGEFMRNLTSIANPTSDPLNYFKDEYSYMKGNRTSGLEMLQELNFLLTYLEYQSSQLTSLSSVRATLIDILSVLSDIRSVGYNVDDKLISLIIPPLHKTYKLLYLSDKKIDKLDELKEWISWSVNSITTNLPYYSEKTLPYMIDLVHLSELNELVEIGQSQNLILFDQFKTSLQMIEILLLGPSSITQNVVESTDGETTVRKQFLFSSQELNSKQNQISDITVKFPSNFASQVDLSSKRSCFIFKSTTKKTDSNIVSKIISLSIQKIDNLAQVSVANLNQTVDIVFDNIETKSSNLSCNYYDTNSNTWSTLGIQTIIKSKSANIYEITCATKHFTTFSVIDNNVIVITPTISVTASPKSSQGNKNIPVDNGATIGLIVGILVSLFIVVVIVIVVIVVVAVVVVLQKRKQTLQKQEQPEETELIEEVTIPSLSDFPSQESAHFTPLMSFSSIKSSDSQNAFNPLSRYKDLVKIGEGAFGSVFKALDTKQNKTKALKIIKYSSAEELNGMMKEGSQLMNIDHENIIKVNDFFVDNSQLLCIDMDFYSNGDLLKLMNDTEWCSERKVKQIIYQICDALNFVHTKLKVIHRDVKPSNIFIRDLDSDNIHVVLADFGLAKASMGSVDRSYAGTPLYMSLELATGGKYSFNTDIYSLGVAIYQIMTKDTTTAVSHMFISNREEEAIDKLTTEMEKSGNYSTTLINICLSMLEKDASKRPSAKQILSNTFFEDILITPTE